MGPIYVVQLYHGGHYCGCWHEPTDAATLARLNVAGFGGFCTHDGAPPSHYPCPEPSRSFFFADEVSETIERAERMTGCYADAERARR